METNPKLLIPYAKYRDGTDISLYACPKKERQDPNSERLKPKWEKIAEAEYLRIYELSRVLKANTNIVLLENDKIIRMSLKRVQDKKSGN